MADWYVSSATYAGVSAFVASHAYSIGDLVKPTAPASNAQHVHRCTTAGTSSTEPTWQNANNATTTSGGATFTNVTGQSAYGWSAAFGNLWTASFSGTGARVAVGDRVFLSSDHSESNLGSFYGFPASGSASFGLIQVVSINRAGSVPPVAADIQTGAAITGLTTGSLVLDAYCNMFWQGITFTVPGTSNISLQFNSNTRKAHYLKDCALVISNNNASSRITTNNIAKVTLDNTTVQFGATGQAIANTQPFELVWVNTPSAIAGATIPTTLFACGTNAPPLSVQCRGVDLSAITGTLCSGTTGTSGGSMKALFESCKIASGVTRLAAPATVTNAGDEVELMNCWDGSNVINERWTYPGSLAADRSTYLSSGAADDIGNYALKLASTARVDKSTLLFDAFTLDRENAAIGSSKTATIEIISPSSLNNDDISLLLEYMGTSGSSIASFINSLPATVLTTPSAITSSSASWTAATQYPAWNPQDLSGITLSNNNLTVTNTLATAGVRATLGLSSGKYYFEFTITSGGQNSIGLVTANAGVSGIAPNPGSIVCNAAGNVMLNGTSMASIGTGNTRIDVAVDLTNALIWFRGLLGWWNSNASTSNDPATGVGGISFSSIATGPMIPYCGTAVSTSQVTTTNFGASAFGGTVPSGFTAGWPLTPTVKQKLQATFTPQVAGRVRGLVRLGRSVSQVWINPQIAIT